VFLKRSLGDLVLANLLNSRETIAAHANFSFGDALVLCQRCRKIDTTKEAAEFRTICTLPIFWTQYPAAPFNFVITINPLKHPGSCAYSNLNDPSLTATAFPSRMALATQSPSSVLETNSISQRNSVGI
jgi:hypothetical protein